MNVHPNFSLHARATTLDDSKQLAYFSVRVLAFCNNTSKWQVKWFIVHSNLNMARAPSVWTCPLHELKVFAENLWPSLHETTLHCAQLVHAKKRFQKCPSNGRNMHAVGLKCKTMLSRKYAVHELKNGNQVKLVNAYACISMHWHIKQIRIICHCTKSLAEH